MPESTTPQSEDPGPLRPFTRALLEDLRVLEVLLERGMIESGVRRIGAEQELFLVDRAMRPARRALEILERLGHPDDVTTELGLFNLEINLAPLVLGGDCLRRMEQQLQEALARVSVAARESGTRVLLAGILPTLRVRDLTLESMTPHPRYHALNRAVVEHRGGELRLQIKGLDELHLSHDNVMCEACNTSFQVHFQVGAEEFPRLYNLAQAITAPVLAAGVNSPVFLQRRLWSETRMAVFQQAVDSRSELHLTRRALPRVIFGHRWVDHSVLEIFREDITRFRVFLPFEPERSSLEMLERGEVPALEALRMHNGTVYRWNRPCYGISDGKPHLRIEHRALPSGPTVIDEMANAAFFHGLMSSLSEELGDVRRFLTFDDAKANFSAAARYGLKARFQWLGGQGRSAEDLILTSLLPLAREGLAAKGIRAEDVERYLGLLEERVKRGRTGSQWAFDSLAAMGESVRGEEPFRVLTASMYDQCVEGRPVHEWKLARSESVDLREACRLVEQVMTTDLFTLRPNDLVDLAASLMDWEHIRHVPVEDEQGRLVGLVSHRHLLRLVGRRLRTGGESIAVHEIMTTNPITARPDTSTLEAMELMREHRVSCLPVVDERQKLVGIVSERDFIQVAARLLREVLSRED